MEKKMHVWVMKPIKFMEKGDRGFTSTANIRFGYTGTSPETMKLYLYIAKDSSILVFESNNFVPIKKIGDGFEGKDFFVKFPKSVHYSLIEVSEIKAEDFLSPVEIDFTIATEELLDEETKEFTAWPFKTLIKTIWKFVDGPNYAANKEVVDEMLKALPTVLGNVLEEYDDEKLEELIADWQEKKEDYKENSQHKGERRKVSIEIFDFVIGLLDQEQERRAEILANSALELLSDSELQTKMKEAEKNQDYELAAQIRDHIKSRINQN